jgi:HD superfamily phosphohydrolase
MKTVYDSVHGFIRLSDLEYKWLKTAWFSRLQQIHQTGPAYRVFPGARHTRYEHSLGVMHLASKLFDHLFSNQLHLKIEKKEVPFYKEILRMAALSHDLGHLPFSHTAEEFIFSPDCHEAWTLKILNDPFVIEFLKPLIEEGNSLGLDAHALIKKVACGQEKFSRYENKVSFNPIERILSEIITGDFFGADRMDYLMRDAYFTGLNYGFFDHEHLIMSLLIEKDQHNDEPIICIDFRGIQACESLLTARYFMYQRLYLNPKVLAYTFMLKYLVKHTIDNTFALDSVQNYIKISDIEVLSMIKNGEFKDPFLSQLQNGLKEDKELYEVLPLTNEELLALENSIDLKDSIFFLSKIKNPTFLTPSVLVKNTFNQLKLFKDCAKMKIPAFSENFVLFERERLSKVLEAIQGAKV